MFDQLASWGLIVLGLVMLIGGGELLVRGASAIAAVFRIPPVVIGLTVVAFGTSAPELGVSLQAAYAEVSDVAVGNIVGSNIFNVLFVLGISALVAPLSITSQLVRFDLPLMLGLSILAWLLARDSMIGRLDGGILFLVFIVYLGFCLRTARRESQAVQAEFAAEYALAEGKRVNLALQVVWIVAGLAMLGLGSRWLVSGAVSVATWFGISQLVIGLTIVAAGTSLPEVVASIMASVRGERDIAVGNAVGSNIFNLGCVLGLSGIVAPNGIPVSEQAIRFDMPVMLVVAAVCLPAFMTGNRISRTEAILFLIGFVVYQYMAITYS